MKTLNARNFTALAFTLTLAGCDAFCAEMRDHAAPHLDAARTAYTFCLLRSMEYRVVSDASRTCEAALAGIDRPNFPPLAEFFAGAAPPQVLPPRLVGLQLDPPEHLMP